MREQDTSTSSLIASEILHHRSQVSQRHQRRIGVWEWMILAPSVSTVCEILFAGLRYKTLNGRDATLAYGRGGYELVGQV